MDWLFLSSLGSATLVWPLAVALGFLLWRDQVKWVGVARWGLALALASVIVAVTKVLFYGWGTGIRAWNLTSFSGHATLATGLWPVALAALAGQSRWGRWLGALCGLGLGLAIAVSRVALQAHPVSEALAGVLLGSLVAGVGLAALNNRQPPAKLRHVLAVGVAVAALLLAAGRWVPHLPSEDWFQRLGVALSGRDGPVDREQWQTTSDQ
jgi:membrane-associated phospholipid phosphatase